MAVDQKEKPKGERIAKLLARAGVASRREVERMIEAGRITLNGEPVTTPATLILDTRGVRVDGKPVRRAEPARLWRYHKARGVVTTSRDERGRETLFDRLPPGLPRVVTVGRLDLNSEGLILLTNDGALARAMELPSTGWLRKYRVRVHGAVDEAALEKLAHGAIVDGIAYGPITAKLERRQGANAWLTMGLREGKNREIRKVLASLGLKVNRLIRTSYGDFDLGKLPPGAAAEVAAATVEKLNRRLAAPTPRRRRG